MSYISDSEESKHSENREDKGFGEQRKASSAQLKKRKGVE
jgi:hypothetical protein